MVKKMASFLFSVKTKSLIISNKRDSNFNPPVYFQNVPIEVVSSHTYLGVTFMNNLKWHEHIEKITVKAEQRLNRLLPLKFKIDRRSLEIMYKSYILPVLEYSNVVWGDVTDYDKEKVEKIQIKALRLITGACARSNRQNLYQESNLLPHIED